MTRLLPGTNGSPNATTLSAPPHRPPDRTPVLITEQEVLLGSVASAAAPPATRRGHFKPAKMMTAIGHLRIRLPERRPVYPRRESVYFESTRLARMMDHL
ncbi:hypothetical protein [Mycolicibacterium thermoresistibile]